MMVEKVAKTGGYRYGFHVKSRALYKSGSGLTRKIVEEISAQKNEPDWMRAFRLKSFEIFEAKKMPWWRPELNDLDMGKIHYYLKPTDRPERDWKDVPDEIKETFERLGVPQAERAFLAGSGAQFESEMIYHNLHETLKKKGVVFLSTDVALKEFPDLFKQHFGTVVPPTDNKFAALNSAVWSGGSFIYVPKGVKVGLPLQAYFRINARSMGQFERTLIVADEGSDVHYVEGCTAPTYSSDSLHAAVVEIIVKKGARCQYTTIQNWSQNVYNLVTKRAFAEEDATMFWLDCNLGSKMTMKYPAVYLKGRGARAEVLSVAVAGKGQLLDTGAKVFHLAPETSSSIRSKSISKDGGRSSYRGFLKVAPGMKGVKSKVSCDALILDEKSRSDTYPKISVEEDNVTVEHEATVSKIGEEQLFYLMSRGLSEQEAATMIVNGFIDPIVKQLPMEYALEMNRLVEMEMEGSVG